ncbi:MAG TPA: hypothetical protein VGN26_09060 [Armatimonadota bacterium]|jgi:hypothetical protein
MKAPQWIGLLVGGLCLYLLVRGIADRAEELVPPGSYVAAVLMQVASLCVAAAVTVAGCTVLGGDRALTWLLSLLPVVERVVLPYAVTSAMTRPGQPAPGLAGVVDALQLSMCLAGVGAARWAHAAVSGRVRRSGAAQDAPAPERGLERPPERRAASPWAWFLAASICGAAVMAWNGSKVSLPKPPPPQALPRPNGFDDVRAAAALVRDRAALASESKRLHLLIAANPITAPLPTPSAETKALLAANAPALARLEPFLTRDYVEPRPSRGADRASYGPIRDLARLLSLRAMAKAGEGRGRTAMDSGLEAVALGLRVPRGAGVSGALWGGALQSIGREPLWSMVDHLAAEDCRADALRLLRLNRGTVPLWESVQEEKWDVRERLRDQMNRAQDGAPVKPVKSDLVPLSADVRPWMARRMLSEAIQAYSDELDVTTEWARRPYAQRGELPEPSVSLSPASMTAAILSPVSGELSTPLTKDQVLNDLLAVTLALRAYRLERGAYPERLAQLVPRYLDAVPQDPFARSGDLRYRRSGSGYVLYSVGPDTRDDGGRPIDKPLTAQGKPRTRYTVLEDSKGDIVAGVNWR